MLYYWTSRKVDYWQHHIENVTKQFLKKLQVLFGHPQSWIFQLFLNPIIYLCEFKELMCNTLHTHVVVLELTSVWKHTLWAVWTAGCHCKTNYLCPSARGGARRVLGQTALYSFRTSCGSGWSGVWTASGWTLWPTPWCTKTTIRTKLAVTLREHSGWVGIQGDGRNAFFRQTMMLK